MTSFTAQWAIPPQNTGLKQYERKCRSQIHDPIPPTEYLPKEGSNSRKRVRIVECRHWRRLNSMICHIYQESSHTPAVANDGVQLGSDFRSLFWILGGRHNHEHQCGGGLWYMSDLCTQLKPKTHCFRACSIHGTCEEAKFVVVKIELLLVFE